MYRIKCHNLKRQRKNNKSNGRKRGRWKRREEINFNKTKMRLNSIPQLSSALFSPFYSQSEKKSPNLSFFEWMYVCGRWTLSSWFLAFICLAFSLFQPLQVLNLNLSWINFSFSIYKRIYSLKMRNEKKTRKVLSRICLWILRDMFILGK